MTLNRLYKWHRLERIFLLLLATISCDCHLEYWSLSKRGLSHYCSRIISKFWGSASLVFYGRVAQDNNAQQHSACASWPSHLSTLIHANGLCWPAAAFGGPCRGTFTRGSFQQWSQSTKLSRGLGHSLIESADCLSHLLTSHSPSRRAGFLKFGSRLQHGDLHLHFESSCQCTSPRELRYIARKRLALRLCNWNLWCGGSLPLTSARLKKHQEFSLSGHKLHTGTDVAREGHMQ